ncbi:MAG: LLM class flavin-dependent oxidoreductase [Gammaproteobacteria bacterium]|nr:LLM class flavin-dependent oxidoreductase [Gammaproteobacteria bacterium]
MTQRSIRIGATAAPTTAGKADHDLYREVIDDCLLIDQLGYDTAWFVEHAFSDYLPHPSPLITMSHIAAQAPELGLATAVLVLPWHNPLRVAGELAMVSALTRGPLLIGIGRGTAKSEYDNYNVDMSTARARMNESYKIIDIALRGEPFTYNGQFFKYDKPLRLRPSVAPGSRIQFYGAIGSPGGAENVAELGLPLLCQSQFPDRLLSKIHDTWVARSRELGRTCDAPNVIQVRTLIKDTDEEAFALAKEWYPRGFAAQHAHYVPDANPWQGIDEYQSFVRAFEGLAKLKDPANIMPFIETQAVGSPQRVARRLQEYLALGFDYLVIHATFPEFPQDIRRETYTRFAKQVAPLLSDSMRGR